MPTAEPAAQQGGPLPLSYDAPDSTAGVGNYRWVICALLFFGTTINYIDRQVMGILGSTLRDDLHITKEQFGTINAWFGVSYALGQLVAGGMLERVGTRIGYAAALAAWSLASIGHAFVRTATGFEFVRVLLGISESPCYPASNKTAAEWFPKRERALVMGLCNAGTNIGMIVAMIMVPLLTTHFGWQGAFVGTGALGLTWLLFWIPIYRRPAEHPRLSAAELAHIESDPPEPAGKVPWTSLATYPQAWAFVASKFITDAIWMFYFAWLPLLLNEKYGLSLSRLGWQLVIVYTMAGVGSILGGMLSSSMLKRGATVNAARKTAMLIAAACVVPVMFAVSSDSPWLCTFLLGLATAGHQAFSANQYTMVSDMFPKRAVASVSGMGGTSGYLGASLFSIICGIVLTRTHNNYQPLLIVAGLAYVVAFTIIHLFAPTMAPAEIPNDDGGGPTGGFPVVQTAR